MAEEIFEGNGEMLDQSLQSEELFQDMQEVLFKLVKKYEIQEDDLKGSLDVISQLWDMVEITNNKCDTLEDQKKDIEEIWNEEKEKRRHTEKKKADLENRFDEERYQWQSERQELQRERAAMETRIKHLGERNKGLLSDLKKQSEKFEEDQKMRDDLMVQYKKQYEIAKTSSLRRSKSKNRIPPYQDYSPRHMMPNALAYSVPSSTAYPQNLGDSHSSLPSVPPELSDPLTSSTPPHRQRRLPNIRSLKTEMKHPRGNMEDIPLHVPLDAESDLLSLQQELFNVGPDILAPAVAELEMLKKEQEERKVELANLQMKAEAYLEDKEKLESDNAQLDVEVEQLKMILDELQIELSMLRQERDEILESYLDQPFDVYCVTKKELHEVLKKLHTTQLEMQKQSEEKQSLEIQLARRRKKSSWKRFATRLRNMFHRQSVVPVESDHNEDIENITSLQIPPEETVTPKKPEEILAMDNFHHSKGWMVNDKEQPTSESLPSLYCQVTLKEYHVTERINCMVLGRVYHSTEPLLTSKRKSTILPLAARTSRGRLCAEVWVASNEGPTCFLEIIDVLAKRIVDRFLVRGDCVTCMASVPGTLSTLKPHQLSSSSSKSKSTAKKTSNDLFNSFNLSSDESEEVERTGTRGKNDSNLDSFALKNYYRSRINGTKPTVPEAKVYDQKSEERSEDRSPNNLFETSSDDDESSFRLTMRNDHFSLSNTEPDSLAKEIMSVERDYDDQSFGRTSSLPVNERPSKKVQVEQAQLLDREGYNPHEESLEVFTDDEGDVHTSTPSKMYESENLMSRNFNKENEERFMWVATNDSILHIYPTTLGTGYKEIKTINLSGKPSCIKYLGDNLCIGLSDSKMIVYHKETIFSGDIWDLENPSFIELPRLNPEKLLPVRDVALVKKKIWVTTGSFVTFLDVDTLISQGSKFLDVTGKQPDKLLPLDSVVLATTTKGSNIFVLDSDRAEVIKKIDISPLSLILDYPLTLSSLDISSIIKDETNVYIGTSTGKIFAMPLQYFELEGYKKVKFHQKPGPPNTSDLTSASYPPISNAIEHNLFHYSAASLNTHREGSVQGLLHIPLPDEITLPMLSNSVMNLSTRSGGILHASSMPSLLDDSPPLSRSSLVPGNLVHPVYCSLLVSGGKGHQDYLADPESKFDGSTALRERNEAFQVIVWGYEITIPEST